MARRSRSTAVSRCSLSVLNEPWRESAPASKSIAMARSSSCAAKAWESRSPAPSVSRFIAIRVRPSLPGGSSAAPPRKVNSIATTGSIASRTSQASMPPGLDHALDLHRLGRAALRRQPGAAAGSGASGKSWVVSRSAAPAWAAAGRSPIVPARRMARAAALTCAVVTSPMRCGQASTSAMVCPVVSAAPITRAPVDRLSRA